MTYLCASSSNSVSFSQLSLFSPPLTCSSSKRSKWNTRRDKTNQWQETHPRASKQPIRAHHTWDNNPIRSQNKLHVRLKNKKKEQTRLDTVTKDGTTTQCSPSPAPTCNFSSQGPKGIARHVPLPHHVITMATNQNTASLSRDLVWPIREQRASRDMTTRGRLTLTCKDEC